MELERKKSVLQHTKGFKTMKGKPTVKWITKRKEEKRQKEDWKALARDKKESRSVIAEAKKKHVKKLKGITCTEELNKGEKKAEDLRKSVSILRARISNIHEGRKQNGGSNSCVRV